MKPWHLASALVMIGAHSFAIAQQSFEHQKTVVPEDSRFEVVQSHTGSRFTFRVDKKDGNVWQLVQSGDRLTWKPVPRRPHPDDRRADASRVNYQLFASGNGAGTYLMNLNTGATWQVAEMNAELVLTPF